METQLNDLIETIKSEGIKNAEEESNKIIEKAQDKAKEIISNAHKEATEIVDSAKKDAHKIEQTGKEALKQAGRDLILKMQTQIAKLFDKTVQNQIENNLKDNVLEKAILTILEKWEKDERQQLTVLLPQDQFENLEERLHKALADKFAEGTELKPSQHIKTGFRISRQDGSVYYNFTGQGIAEFLSESLNPRMREILQEAVRSDEE